MKYGKILLAAALCAAVSAAVWQADKRQVERRAVFLDGQLRSFEAAHGEYPKPYEWLKDERADNESYCGFFSRAIDGWGYCYADDPGGAWRPAVWGWAYRAVFDKAQGRFVVQPIGSGWD